MKKSKLIKLNLMLILKNITKMAEERVRYSDAELQEFKKIIQDKIAKAEKDLILLTKVSSMTKIMVQMTLLLPSKLSKKEQKR